MRKRSSKKLTDADEPAVEAVESVPVADAAAEPSSKPSLPRKNPTAVALGKLGGKKGGLARAAKLSAQVRSQIARKAAQARWSKGNGALLKPSVG